MQQAIPNLVAGGDINPCRFVSLVADGSTPANRTVWQSTNGVASGTEGDHVFGISGEGTRRFDATLHAVAGEHVEVGGPGTYMLLELGTGGCTAGAMLKSNADGKGIAISADDDRVGGMALEAGAEGAKVMVFVHPFTNSNITI